MLRAELVQSISIRYPSLGAAVKRWAVGLLKSKNGNREEFPPDSSEMLGKGGDAYVRL